MFNFAETAVTLSNPGRWARATMGIWDGESRKPDFIIGWFSESAFTIHPVVARESPERAL